VADTTASIVTDSLAAADSVIGPAAHIVPMRPPDTLSKDAYQNMDRSWNVPYDIVVLAFKDSTSVERKSAIVHAISGRVLGGAPLTNIDGFYVVRVPTTTVPELLLVIESLRKVDGVLSAGMNSAFTTLGGSPM
jgi:hypothetical protein